ncbi:DNA polymerase III, delta subunit [Belliella baltica DSM 15883]|uniref:DNA polymerase III subunit delta n=1 Tax=Belliella baltica (strain DSM 15883 / CIP 108006 / LMG 21964 / BA134) TaxID=866536 RepID=I3Z8H5_BELBD|nr:DNA polymerase III subunit delta [Belliella baltica]AFL85543.1 DNA polymerase III, delta subunit [Belliella baltica DSM 15883]
MPSKPEDVIKDLKAGKYAPIYFLQGEEPHFIDVISDYIEKHAIAEHEKGFNQTIMYGKDAPMTAILGNARRFPMMADRQVVIVKEAQNIWGIGREEIDTLLINYIQNPLPSTILVFAFKYKSLDGRKALAKELDKKAVLVKSDKVPEYKLAAWIEGYIQTQGHKIDNRTAVLLAESIGNNLEVMTNEIGKMLINFTESTQITAEHIHKFIGINKDYNNFELTKAIGVRDVLKANKIIHYFLQNPKANPLIPTIIVIYNYFSRLALYHDLKGASDAELAKKLGVNPYFVKEYHIAAKNYNLGKVIEAFAFIKEADLRSKGVDLNKVDESLILKEMIFKIMH